MTSREPPRRPRLSDPARSETSPETWGNWPRCPDCDHRRRVECPICGVSGTHIPLGDTWGEEEPLRATRGDRPAGDAREPAEARDVLLLCPCCDEPYRPRFFRYCEWCGHDFRVGIERAGDPVPLGPRVLWTAAGLMGLLLGLLAWFSYVLNR